MKIKHSGNRTEGKEKKMKRTLPLLIVIALMISLLGACSPDAGDTSSAAVSDTASDGSDTSKQPEEEKTLIRIGGLTGPTSIGMVKIMSDAEAGEADNDYEFTIAGSADELTPLLIRGELDMAAVPANLASVLYNNTDGAVQILAVNTLGVLYIVETGDGVGSLADLKGNTIYATGKGSTPEYTLRYLLEQNGINPDSDVTIEWKSEPTEVVALLKGGADGVAMLPQPYVTAAQNQVEGLRIAVDLNDEWEKADTGSKLLTGTMVVRKEFAEAHPEAISAFLAEYKESIDYVNANVAEAAPLVEKYGIATAAIAEKAIPYCNITYMAGDEMKAAMETYLGVLFDKNPTSVGGALPDDGFYYSE